jgi:hypothetical protein
MIRGWWKLLSGARHRTEAGGATTADFRVAIDPTRRPTLEVHVPISPTPTFLYMLLSLTHSLRRNGGAYRHAPVIATVGDEGVDVALADRLPWLRANGIELRWVPREQFLALSYAATGNQRLQYEHASDVVLLLDADVLIAGPFDELVERVYTEQVIAGVLAHVSPFECLSQPKGWKRLYKSLGLRSLRMDHEHTGWGALSKDARFRHCPAYFNYGVVCAPRAFIQAIGQAIEGLLQHVRRRYPKFFFDNQVALALAIAKLGLPYLCLPIRYNFPNDPHLERLRAAELPHTRIIHLLRDHQGVYKTKLFASLENLEAFARRTDVDGINQMAQRVIAEILPALQAEGSLNDSTRPLHAVQHAARNPGSLQEAPQ